MFMLHVLRFFFEKQNWQMNWNKKMFVHIFNFFTRFLSFFFILGQRILLSIAQYISSYIVFVFLVKTCIKVPLLEIRVMCAKNRISFIK